MRTKNFIFLLVLVILLSILLIVFGPSNNENLANITNLANQQIRQIKVRPLRRKRKEVSRELKKSLKFKENLQVERKEKELDVDPKYLQLLGFHDFTSASTTRGSTHIYNITRQNFSIVSYVLQNELAAAILQLQNIQSVLPTETSFLIYDLGLVDVDLQTLSGTINNIDELN